MCSPSLTGHPVVASRLPASVRDSLPPAIRNRPTLGANDLSAEALAEIRNRFNDAVASLVEVNRLGTVLFQFSSAFRPDTTSYAAIERLRVDFPVLPIAVEFRHRDWAGLNVWARTLDQLRDLEITIVAVDAPGGFASAMPPVDGVTTPGLAVLRLHGRNSAAWEGRHATAVTRFQYRYSDSELEGDVLPSIRRLASEVNGIHMLFNNCFGADGDHSAATIRRMIDAVGPAK